MRLSARGAVGQRTPWGVGARASWVAWTVVVDMYSCTTLSMELERRSLSEEERCECVCFVCVDRMVEGGTISWCRVRVHRARKRTAAAQVSVKRYIRRDRRFITHMKKLHYITVNAVW